MIPRVRILNSSVSAGTLYPRGIHTPGFKEYLELVRSTGGITPETGERT